MASLRDIRGRIASVKNTQQITRAMKMVAAAKLRKAQERIFQTRPYAFRIREMVTHLRGRIDPTSHPLFEDRPAETVLVVVVTSDRGLAGAFNANILKRAESAIEERYAQHRAEGRLKIMALGRKGHDHFRKRDYQLVGDYRGLFNRLESSDAVEVTERIVEGFRAREWDEVVVVYNEFKNTITQNRVVEPFLPVPREAFATPVMEADAGFMLNGEGAPAGEVEYIFEPSAEGILDRLIPQYLTFQILRVLLESNAAEQGARMVAMDNATTNAGELLGQLTLAYNRARQAAITTEIIEISSGAEALQAGN
jgi:F-type H+-transporting ATPase subunit gamma